MCLLIKSNLPKLTPSESCSRNWDDKLKGELWWLHDAEENKQNYAEKDKLNSVASLSLVPAPSVKKSIYDLEKQQQQKNERKNISALRHSCLCWWKNIKVFPRWLCPEKRRKIFLPFGCKTELEKHTNPQCCWMKQKFLCEKFHFECKKENRENFLCRMRKCSASEGKWIYWAFKAHKNQWKLVEGVWTQTQNSEETFPPRFTRQASLAVTT
jgi:hypothetical protein